MNKCDSFIELKADSDHRAERSSFIYTNWKFKENEILALCFIRIGANKRLSGRKRASYQIKCHNIEQE